MLSKISLLNSSCYPNTKWFYKLVSHRRWTAVSWGKVLCLFDPHVIWEKYFPIKNVKWMSNTRLLVCINNCVLWTISLFLFQTITVNWATCTFVLHFKDGDSKYNHPLSAIVINPYQPKTNVVLFVKPSLFYCCLFLIPSAIPPHYYIV